MQSLPGNQEGNHIPPIPPLARPLFRTGLVEGGDLKIMQWLLRK